MSHFTVLVVGDNVDEALAPFQENNMGDCPKQYMEFTDQEAEFRKEYEEGGMERVVMPDGSFKTTWDEEFRIPGTYGSGSDTHKVPEGLEVREIPFKEIYSTFEEFVEDYHGYNGRDEETNRYGYWENPNRKWDWYAIGGRWTGFFKLKGDSLGKGQVGRPGLMTAPAKPGFADQALKGDIDFEAMRRLEAQEANDTYDLVEPILKEHGMPRSFEEIAAECDKDYDAARKLYWEQPAVKALQEASLMPWGSSVNALYGGGRESYVERRRNQACSTFAVLKDGKWYEKGEMGWWGMVSNEKDQDEWNRQFNALLDSLPDETLLTVVDCHI